MKHHCKLYAPGITVIVLSLMFPLTSNSIPVLVVRGVLIGLSLLLSAHENIAMYRRRGRRSGRRAGD